MPNIDSYLAKIREAVYGEEVRGSIHDALAVMNNNIDASEQQQLRLSIAPIWDQANAYSKGDYVWHPTTKGTLYKAKEDVAAGTAWSTANWKEETLVIGLNTDFESIAVELDDEVSDLKSAVSDISVIYESTNLLDEDAVEDGFIYNLSGTRQASSTMASTAFIPVTVGKIIVFGNDEGLKQARYITAYNSSKVAVSGSGGEYSTYGYTVPSGIAYIKISASQRASLLTQHPRVNMIDSGYALLPYEPYGSRHEPLDHQAFLALKDKCENVISENVLNNSTIENGKFININGAEGTSATYAVTDYIKVEENDVVSGYYGSIGNLFFRYITAYDIDKTVLPSDGVQNVETYTVPANVKYVRITGYLRTDGSGINSTNARIFLNNTDYGYQKYKDESVFKFAKENYTDIQRLLNYPLKTLPQHFLKTLSYKPLGTLSKGYICLVSDDGDADLATYTIPMLQAKGDVPCTFAVMSASAVFTTQSGTNAVIDAVENHGCEIAQHGPSAWINYDEYTLSKFFDGETTWLSNLGLTAYGAVCPAHEINDIIRAVAGGRYGCLRTGYASSELYYGTYCNGPRNNLYGLCSQSSLDGTLDGQKAILDECKTNHWLRMIHWHEVELNSDKKAQLEGIIDYAQQIGLTFITMKDIPTIV